MIPAIVCALFYLAVFALAVWKPNAARYFLGFFFLVMAFGVNAVLLFINPQIYVDMAAGALIPFYRDAFTAVVSASPTFWVSMLILWETAVGLLLLFGRGKQVRAGMIMGIIFALGITPLGVEELPNPILAALFGYLLTKEFPTSLIPGA